MSLLPRAQQLRRKIHLPYFIHQNDGTDGPGRENKDNPSRSSRDWGWSNNYKDWSENYDQSYKARQISRSKSPPSQPIRLKERAVSPSMVHAKQRQREYREHGPSDRSPPHGRREVFYEPPAMKPEEMDGLLLFFFLWMEATSIDISQGLIGV